MVWKIKLVTEESGWRWTANIIRPNHMRHFLSGWAYGTRYNAICSAKNKIAYKHCPEEANEAEVIGMDKASLALIRSVELASKINHAVGIMLSARQFTKGYQKQRVEPWEETGAYYAGMGWRDTGGEYGY